MSERATGVVLPKRLAQIFRERGEHDVEANADSLFIARVAIDGVLQIGGEHQKSSVRHPDYNLVSILGSEFSNRRPDNAGLISRVMKVYCVRTRASSNVIDAAQEVIGVAVSLVYGPL